MIAAHLVVVGGLRCSWPHRAVDDSMLLGICRTLRTQVCGAQTAAAACIQAAQRSRSAATAVLLRLSPRHQACALWGFMVQFIVMVLKQRTTQVFVPSGGGAKQRSFCNSRCVGAGVGRVIGVLQLFT